MAEAPSIKPDFAVEGEDLVIRVLFAQLVAVAEADDFCLVRVRDRTQMAEFLIRHLRTTHDPDLGIILEHAVRDILEGFAMHAAVWCRLAGGADVQAPPTTSWRTPVPTFIDAKHAIAHKRWRSSTDPTTSRLPRRTAMIQRLAIREVSPPPVAGGVQDPKFVTYAEMAAS